MDLQNAFPSIAAFHALFLLIKDLTSQQKPEVSQSVHVHGIHCSYYVSHYVEAAGLMEYQNGL